MDLAQAIIPAYIALTVPFRVGLKQPAEGGWYVLDLIIDLYFYVDVVLNFVTGFEESSPTRRRMVRSTTPAESSTTRRRSRSTTPGRGF